MTTHHPDKTRLIMAPCNKCPFVSDTSSQLNYHKKCHTVPYTHKCRHCMYLCSTSKHFSVHREECRARRFKLNTQQAQAKDGNDAGRLLAKTLNKTNLLEQSRALLWTAEHRYYCKHCHFEARSADSYSKHVESEHIGHRNQSLNACHLCPYVTNRQDIIWLHFKNHDNERALLCPHCPSLASCDQVLKQHIMICRRKKYVEHMASKRAITESTLSYEETSDRRHVGPSKFELVFQFHYM